MPERERRELARQAIDEERMPTIAPTRVWGGPGTGLPCAVCQRPVGADEMEVELDLRPDGGRPELDVYHLHARCYAAWEFERGGNAR